MKISKQNTLNKELAESGQWVDYIDGAQLKIAYFTNERKKLARAKAVEKNKKGRRPSAASNDVLADLDMDIFNKEYLKQCVKDWKGFTEELKLSFDSIDPDFLEKAKKAKKGEELGVVTVPNKNGIKLDIIGTVVDIDTESVTIDREIPFSVSKLIEFNEIIDGFREFIDDIALEMDCFIGEGVNEQIENL